MGEGMQVEIEHQIFSVAIDDDMQTNLNRITSQGWRVIPEIKPVAIYHMVRAKNAPLVPMGVGAKMEIDDQKVGTLKQDGYVYWPDGTRSKQGEPWEARKAFT